jgi:hypothetical protein
VSAVAEVNVRRLTAEGTVGEATRVSTNGGTEPRWSRDGRELFFLTTPQGFSSAQMMAVAAQAAGPALEFGAPAPLFKVRMLPVQQVTRDYDLSARRPAVPRRHGSRRAEGHPDRRRPQLDGRLEEVTVGRSLVSAIRPVRPHPGGADDRKHLRFVRQLPEHDFGREHGADGNGRSRR